MADSKDGVFQAPTAPLFVFSVITHLSLRSQQSRNALHLFLDILLAFEFNNK